MICASQATAAALARRFFAVLISLACLANAGLALSQISIEGDSPIHIKAEKSTYMGNEILLEGKVVVKQGDAQIFSDVMQIYRQAASEGSEAEHSRQNMPSLGTVTRIVATGHFRYITPESKISGTQGEYFRQIGKIVITGNVQVLQRDGSVIRGQKLTYDINKQTTQINDPCQNETCSGSRVSFSVKQ